MGIIGWIIVGIIAGFIAEKVTNSNHGLFTNLIVGLIGAFVGGFLANRLGIHLVHRGSFIDTTIIATLGAILVLFVYQKVLR
ncbi:GlsB/YeaQ/YmgE family stress response membrane protein [uncultured Cohaesibacter sp.]|uniref:GlsB/YeaQ/YmgE family stress response membrane protein n=1 Tax=uncultured Cohaesibacter sp. TaxID=1002546 RepID=UPI0029C8E9B0|nr:GlsB/YeaQ/YmgE family stress response membrane protein [uncultured Cohaesibacter sp.]